MGYINRVLEGEDATRRQAVKAIGAAATTGAIAGCSDGSAKPEPQPEKPEPKPEDNKEETQPEETENQYNDFDPEPMSLLEIAQKASVDNDPLLISAYDPQALENEYDKGMFGNPVVDFPTESGFSKTDSPAALYQWAKGNYIIRAGQLPAKHPKDRVVQSLENGGYESLVSNDNFEILGDDKAAQIVNDEILATIWGTGGKPESSIETLVNYAENYGNNGLPSRTEELTNNLQGDDVLTVHRDENTQYLVGARDSVQPDYAVTRGDFGEGVETVWSFEDPILAEAAAEFVNESELRNPGGLYNPPAKQDSNLLYAEGNGKGVKAFFRNDSAILGSPRLSG